VAVTCGVVAAALAFFLLKPVVARAVARQRAGAAATGVPVRTATV